MATKIRYIFCINTGRSGSHYLAQVLNEFEGIVALHEPRPVLNGGEMVNFLSGDSAAMEGRMEEKLDAIKEALRDKECYIETNHTFIKGFGWLIPFYLPHEELGVIVLKRNKQEIVDSLLRINCTPLTMDGLMWLMTPLMKDPINPLGIWDKRCFRLVLRLDRILMRLRGRLGSKMIRRWVFGRFDRRLLEWYVEETYAQAKRFARKFPNIRMYETELDKVNDIRGIQEMLGYFGLKNSPKKSVLKLLGVRTNLKVQHREKG